MTARKIPKNRGKSPSCARGRPNQSAALRKRILAAGVDPELVDERRVLAAIAIDETAPAAARVSACRVLMTAKAGLPRLHPPVEREDEPEDDALTRRALEIMSGSRRLDS